MTFADLEIMLLKFPSISSFSITVGTQLDLTVNK